MDNNSVGSNNTKDDIRYFPESIVKVSIDMDEYLRLKETERECIQLRKGEEVNTPNTVQEDTKDSVYVVECDDCYDLLHKNLYNELDALYTKYRGAFIWNLDITLCGVIAFYVRHYLEDSPEDFNWDEPTRLRYNTLAHAVSSLEYYFDRSTKGGGDNLDEDARKVVLEALAELREYWFSMWT